MAREASIRGSVSFVKRISEEVSRYFFSLSGNSSTTTMVSGVWREFTRRKTATAEQRTKMMRRMGRSGDFFFGLDLRPFLDSDEVDSGVDSAVNVVVGAIADSDGLILWD